MGKEKETKLGGGEWDGAKDSGEKKINKRFEIIGIDKQ